MDVKELYQIGDFWQDRLRIRDWDVKYEWTHLHELGDKHGTIKWNKVFKSAVVSVSIPNELEGYNGVVPNTEVIVVHELLHILFNYTPLYTEDSLNYNAEEHALYTVANTLVSMRYKYGKI